MRASSWVRVSRGGGSRGPATSAGYWQLPTAAGLFVQVMASWMEPDGGRENAGDSKGTNNAERRHRRSPRAVKH
jgi:hypothetical protein